MSAAVLTPTLNSRVGSLDEFCGTEGVYLLPHHQDEIDRLQRQHNFIKTATDGQLVPVKLPAGARILDSGCADGTYNPTSLAPQLLNSDKELGSLMLGVS